MKRPSKFTLWYKVAVVTILLCLLCGARDFHGQERDQERDEQRRKKRERAMDRIVHIEEGIVWTIPSAPRLCDELDIQRDRVDIGGCTLYCEQEGEGTPLVLVHGGPGATHHHFHPHFSRAAAFARVIYYDQRGCGLSDYKPGDGYTVDQSVDDLERLRQALDIDQWVVLGHSYGGIPAQCYAIKYPENLKGLVLVCASTGLHGQSLPSRARDFISQREREKIAEIRTTPGLSTAQMVYNNLLNGDWKRQSYYKPSRERMAQMIRYEWVHDSNFNSTMSESAAEVDLEGAFIRCPIPTLILEGKWDMSWNTGKPARFHGNHPKAKLVVFADSGHSAFEDEPKLFFNTLKDFIIDLPHVPAEELEQWKGYLVTWRQKQQEKKASLLGAEISPGEAQAIEYFEKTKWEILRGQAFSDQSTPPHAFLTLISAYCHKDPNALEQILPLVKRQQFKKLSSPQVRTKMLDFVQVSTVCRIPVYSGSPKESDVCAVYTSASPDKEIDQAFSFCFVEGAWRFAGSTSDIYNWIPQARQVEAMTRSILELEQEEAKDGP